MGNWQLEVAKMAVYMAFPVASFYVYHQVNALYNRELACLNQSLNIGLYIQVDWFEDKLEDIHKKVRTRETIENSKEIQEYVEMLRSHR